MAKKKTASQKRASTAIRKEMHALKRGSKRVKSRKQAIAIGLSKARKKR